MKFTEAKHEFDCKYSTVTDYDCFLPEHLTFGKKPPLPKRMELKTSNIINGSFYMPSFNQGYLQQILLVQKYSFQKVINLLRL